MKENILNAICLPPSQNSSVTLGRNQTTHPALLLQSGHHNDGVGPLLPHHPPEVTERLWQWTLSGNVGVLLAVAVDVVAIDVVTSWYACNSAFIFIFKCVIRNYVFIGSQNIKEMKMQWVCGEFSIRSYKMSCVDF